jgi:hypothetical protein
MSKVLETLVKGNLEGHLKRVNGLPSSQYGFRPKKSCTSALAHAQAGWLSGAAKGKVVCLMAFNLSAAFDTCGGRPAGANAASPGSHGTGAPVVCLLHDGRKTERGLGWHGGRPRQRHLR